MKNSRNEITGDKIQEIILENIKIADRCGYELVQKVRGEYKGKIYWQEAEIYLYLSRLEELRYIKSYWVRKDKGRARRYYRILPKSPRIRKEHEFH